MNDDNKKNSIKKRDSTEKIASKIVLNTQNISNENLKEEPLIYETVVIDD